MNDLTEKEEEKPQKKGDLDFDMPREEFLKHYEQAMKEKLKELYT